MQAMEGQSGFFKVPNQRRDLTQQEISRIYEATGCKPCWRARPNRGKGKWLSATGPCVRCPEAVQMAMEFMQAEEEPQGRPGPNPEAVRRMEEGAAQRRARDCGHWRFQAPALLASETFSCIFNYEGWGLDGLTFR